jgi:hypothetical protein
MTCKRPRGSDNTCEYFVVFDVIAANVELTSVS